MADGVSIEFVRARNGDGFVLSRTTASGRKTRIPLGATEILGLQEMIAISRDQILSQFRSESGDVEPIYVLDVSGARATIEALGERVLLTLIAPSGHETTHALPRHVVQFIIEKIPLLLAHEPVLATRQ